MQLYTKILIGMAVGVVLGFVIGPNTPLLNHDGVKLSRSAMIVAGLATKEAAPMS